MAIQSKINPNTVTPNEAAIAGLEASFTITNAAVATAVSFGGTATGVAWIKNDFPAAATIQRTAGSGNLVLTIPRAVGRTVEVKASPNSNPAATAEQRITVVDNHTATNWVFTVQTRNVTASAVTAADLPLVVNVKAYQ